jgi:hypothetical protein
MGRLECVVEVKTRQRDDPVHIMPSWAIPLAANGAAAGDEWVKTRVRMVPAENAGNSQRGMQMWDADAETRSGSSAARFPAREREEEEEEEEEGAGEEWEEGGEGSEEEAQEGGLGNILWSNVV